MQRLKSIFKPSDLFLAQKSYGLGLYENWLFHLGSKAVEMNGKAFEVPKTTQGFFAQWKGLPYMRDYLEAENPEKLYETVSQPAFKKGLKKAQDLFFLGLDHFAKWELYSMERRTRNKDFLKSLMFEYYRNKIFHRSSHIGTWYLADLRAHLGLHLGASLWQFSYPRAYEALVLKESENFKVPPELIWSIMKAETNFRLDSVSPVGAKGLMQIMTRTGRKVASLMGGYLKENELLRPETSIRVGTRYLQRVLKKFEGRIPLAAAAYNGGPHRVHAWLSQFGRLQMDEFIEHIPFKETRNYVKKVVRYYTIYNLLYNKDIQATSWLADHVNVHLEGTPPTRETWEVL